MDGLAEGQIKIKSVGQKIVELEERKEQAGKGLQDLDLQIVETKKKVVSASTLQGRLTTFSELYAEATSEEKKNLLALHINQIVWTPQEICLALFKSPTEHLLIPSGNVQSVSLSGSGGRTRTCGQVVNSHLLCQLSYAGMGKR